MKKATKKATATKGATLPKGILATDLKYPSLTSKNYPTGSFELWNVTGMGWVIPTLLISSGTKNPNGKRTYAAKIDDGKVCRVGMGPHVTEKHTVWVTAKSAARLAPFLALRTQGEADAGMVRDRISSRRAQGQMHRAEGKTHWMW